MNYNKSESSKEFTIRKSKTDIEFKLQEKSKPLLSNISQKGPYFKEMMI